MSSPNNIALEDSTLVSFPYVSINLTTKLLIFILIYNKFSFLAFVDFILVALITFFYSVVIEHSITFSFLIKAYHSSFGWTIKETL